MTAMTAIFRASGRFCLAGSVLLVLAGCGGIEPWVKPYERDRLAEIGARLDSLSPLAVLARGYGLVRRARDGAIVRRLADVSPGERLAIRVAEAELDATLNAGRALEKG